MAKNDLLSRLSKDVKSDSNSGKNSKDVIESKQQIFNNLADVYNSDENAFDSINSSQDALNLAQELVFGDNGYLSGNTDDDTKRRQLTKVYNKILKYAADSLDETSSQAKQDFRETIGNTGVKRVGNAIDDLFGNAGTGVDAFVDSIVGDNAAEWFGGQGVGDVLEGATGLALGLIPGVNIGALGALAGDVGVNTLAGTDDIINGYEYMDELGNTADDQAAKNSRRSGYMQALLGSIPGIGALGGKSLVNTASNVGKTIVDAAGDSAELAGQKAIGQAIENATQKVMGSAGKEPGLSSVMRALSPGKSEGSAVKGGGGLRMSVSDSNGNAGFSARAKKAIEEAKEAASGNATEETGKVAEKSTAKTADEKATSEAEEALEQAREDTAKNADKNASVYRKGEELGDEAPSRYKSKQSVDASGKAVDNPPVSVLDADNVLRSEMEDASKSGFFKNLRLDKRGMKLPDMQAALEQAFRTGAEDADVIGDEAAGLLSDLAILVAKGDKNAAKLLSSYGIDLQNVTPVWRYLNKFASKPAQFVANRKMPARVGLSALSASPQIGASYLRSEEQ